MYPVDQAFLDRLTGFRSLVTTLTVTPPGADAVHLDGMLTAGKITVDRSQTARRRASLTLVLTPDDYQTLTIPGALVQIQHGFQDGNTPTTIPVLTGEVNRASFEPATRTATVDVTDLSVWLSRVRFLSPYTAPPLSRADVIAELVTDARPGTTVLDLTGDSGTLSGGSVWDSDRTQAIKDLATDGSLETFFAPDGTYVIRPVPTAATPPVYTIRAGALGTLTQLARTLPLDKLYNTVVVRPSGTDQTWTQQTVQVTDPTHPRNPAKIGVVPYFWSSPTIQTADVAVAAAQTILDRVLGTAETLSLSAQANPALDASDVIRVVQPQIAGDTPRIGTYLIDSFDFDLRTGGMTLQTRTFDELVESSGE